MNERMKTWSLCAMLVSGLGAGQALAADQQDVTTAQPEKSEKMSPLSGTPVNSAISGGGIVPKGMLLTALNFSYRDKDDIVDDAGRGARTSQQELYLLKLRYGMTDRFEILFVPGYINNHRDAYFNQQSDRVDGPTDFIFGGTYTPLSQRLGDPISLGLNLSVGMPTGQDGSKYLPGGDVWSYCAKIGITKVWHPNHRVDWDLGFAQPTETGNQGVRKDTVVTMTGSYHYVFNPNFDIGLEFTVENSKDWERNGVSMRNEYTEMYVGPTMNFCLPKWNMWLGAGVFVPVMRDYDIPTASDDIRIELKLGKVWSW
ncbi:MAG: transporter [Desulfobulbus sp.]|uniref:transporter n=1 Tax=Desulfobulbus sp. TaxID=895 RepID=UPI00283FE0BA|nr:transporter [Desulfobulbus sp.]MDR2549027.1 transporter [Desulfobulbus sp.]